MSRIEYKNSGIFWQPFIPKSWHVTRLKYILKKLSREKGADDELLVCSNSGDIKKRGDSRLGLVANSNDIYQGVRSGDLLIHGMDTWHGAIAVSKFDGMCTPVVHVCDSSQNKEYVAAYLRNMASQQIFKLISNGVRQNTSDFRSWDKLSRIPIPLPPLAEQEKIVSYLEDKIAKIDEVILAKGEQIKLLQELKDAEIANVVTRGLNPDVKMKDSAISWIGQIPAHWKVVRLKAILRESKEKTSVDGGTLLSLSQYTGIMPKDSTNKMGMFEAESTVGYNIVHPGQFVMNIMLAWNGSYAVSDYEGVISPAYCVFNFNVDCEKKYFHYLLRLPAYSGAFKTQSKGIIDSRLRLYPQYFLAFKTIVPPIEEQRLIVDYIESKCNKADSLISDLEAEIDYLKEYKQKLVADCVTGQINVQCEQ
jgi:type I restriction enzyme S subunit